MSVFWNIFSSASSSSSSRDRKRRQEHEEDEDEEDAEKAPNGSAPGEEEGKDDGNDHKAPQPPPPPSFSDQVIAKLHKCIDSGLDPQDVIEISHDDYFFTMLEFLSEQPEASHVSPFIHQVICNFYRLALTWAETAVHINAAVNQPSGPFAAASSALVVRGPPWPRHNHNQWKTGFIKEFISLNVQYVLAGCCTGRRKRRALMEAEKRMYQINDSGSAASTAVPAATITTTTTSTTNGGGHEASALAAQSPPASEDIVESVLSTGK